MGTATHGQFVELSASSPSNASEISHLYEEFEAKFFSFFLAVRGILVEMS